jgi:hypothetical protein
MPWDRKRYQGGQQLPLCSAINQASLLNVTTAYSPTAKHKRFSVQRLKPEERSTQWRHFPCGMFRFHSRENLAGTQIFEFLASEELAQYQRWPAMTLNIPQLA